MIINKMIALTALLLSVELVVSEINPKAGPYAATYETDNKWGFLGTRSYEPKCLPIPDKMKLCQNLPYTEMRLPNNLNHEQIEEAIDHSQQWVLLESTECHYAVKDFLCSMFAPVCLQRFMLVKPCRSFCLSVKNKCEPVMNTFNFTWPKIFACNQFPQSKKLCIPLPPKLTPKYSEGNKKPVPVCKECLDKRPVATVVANFCRTKMIAMRVKVRHVDRSSRRRIQITNRRKIRFFKKPSAHKRRIAKMPVIIKRENNCVCPHLKADKKYLLLGKVVKREIAVTMILPFRRKNKNFSTVLRLIKQPNVCQREGIMKVIRGYRYKPGGGRARNKKTKAFRRKGRSRWRKHSSLRSPPVEKGRRRFRERQRIFLN